MCGLYASQEIWEEEKLRWGKLGSNLEICRGCLLGTLSERLRPASDSSLFKIAIVGAQPGVAVPHVWLAWAGYVRLWLRKKYLASASQVPASRPFSSSRTLLTQRKG